MFLLLAQVLPLNASNFNDYSTKIVKFYAPWCGHCREFAPEFIKYSEDADITCGEVDCTTEEALCREFGISGFPAVKLFLDGAIYDYDGERKADALQLFVTAMRQPALVLDRPVNESAVYFVYSSTDLEADQHLFGAIKGKVQLTARIGSQGFVAVVAGKQVQFAGPFDEDSISGFVFMYKHGFFPQMTPYNFAEISKRELAIFVHGEDQEFQLIEQKAHTFSRSRLNYAHLDGERWKDYVAEFGCHKLPCAIFLDQYRKFGVEIESQMGFMQAVSQYESGELKSSNGILAAKYEQYKDAFTAWIQQYSQLKQTLLIMALFVAAMFIIAIPLIAISVRCCCKKEARTYTNIASPAQQQGHDAQKAYAAPVNATREKEEPLSSK